MARLVLGGSRISGGFRTVPIVSAVLQDRVLGGSMNSLLYHADDYQAVPPWIKRMTDANGGQTITAQMSFASETASAPNYNQNWEPLVTSPGATASWASIDSVNFTDMIIVTDNFSGPPILNGAETDPSIGGPVPRPAEGTWVTEWQNIITAMAANTDDEPTFWLYEGWADGGQFLNADGSGTTQEFSDWRDLTTTTHGYTTWFDSLLSQTKANNSAIASRIKILPVARTLVSVMELASLSTLTAADWFEDDAPHGEDVCYLVAAMVCYTAMFEEQAPTPSFASTTVPAVFQSNYTAIAAHIAGLLL